MCSWTEFLEKSWCVIAVGDLRRRAEETAGRKSDGTRIKASAESVLRGHCRTLRPPIYPSPSSSRSGDGLRHPYFIFFVL